MYPRTRGDVRGPESSPLGAELWFHLFVLAVPGIKPRTLCVEGTCPATELRPRPKSRFSDTGEEEEPKDASRVQSAGWTEAAGSDGVVPFLDPL